ncbi:putative thiazole-containing bacteriocin maturation protein [Brevibacillus sp. B_LB10_24]|uniref:putative thiazole-containing bacteriocin maturation protein n=1 Tax=Brevibacillus sp. B_LB10_24 TaxID=3380645 RepID=UPI0038B71CD2
MAGLDPSTRLKVKGDTFFLPDPKGSVYFRNNLGSFRMEGSAIDQWIEKLIPVLNGEHTLHELTDGLPDEYRDRVYEIAESLYQNGFAQDVSRDRPHQLPEEVRKTYAAQIEFLDSFGGSGVYRFETYRQSKVLAIGSGPFFVSLVAALLESGLPKFHVLLTESMPTDRQKLAELADDARKSDPEVEIREIALQREKEGFWREAVKPFDSIFYVSQEGDLEELRMLHAICREERKVFAPAICLFQAGLAGPLVHPDAEGCWESALRRIHRSAVCKDSERIAFSSTAGAMLANVLVFEWIKMVTEVYESEWKNTFYLLDLETWEGTWYSFIPHPMVTGQKAPEEIQDLHLLFETSSDRSETNRLFAFFSSITSAESGILHILDEGDMKQLPLALCRVQAVDPLSRGPAELLPDVVCAGLTHEEARRDAGLAGIEAYVTRMIVPLGYAGVGVGAGETVAEAVCRGLQKCLAEELANQQLVEKPTVFPVEASAVEDDRCRFYLEALATLQGAPTIGLGVEVLGFPVVWVGTNDRWYGSVGLHVTAALRKALQHALTKAQNQSAGMGSEALEASSVLLSEKVQHGAIFPAYEETARPDVLQSALQTLKKNNQRLMLLDLAIEPFLQEELAGVFGVALREEGTR